MHSLLLLSALCGLSAAHFELKFPKSIGFQDDNESKAPCGGFTPDFSKDVVDFHVGGEAIAVRLTHSQCNWLFRVTTDQKAEGGWEQIFPIVQQSGLGDFCEPAITIPEKYVGKKGVVSVVSSAVDGLLYQCIAANFVNGTSSPPSACKNASSVTASFNSDAQLSALLGNPDTSKTSSSSAAPSSTKDSAAMALSTWSKDGSAFGGMLALLSMAVMGGALLI